MPRLTKRLTNTEVDKAKPKTKEYSLSDGDGLSLRIKPNGSKLWLFNYYHPTTKKRTNAGLGMYPAVSLAQARQKREEYRTLLAQNIDPQVFRAEESQKQVDNTFKQICKRWFEEIYPTKAHNPETRAKNWQRLENHIFPAIGNMTLDKVTPRVLVGLYRSIGSSNTLDKLHRLIKSTLDYGVKLGLIEGHNCNIAKDDFIAPIAKNHPAILPKELPQLLALMNNAFDDGKLEPNTFLAFNLALLTGLRQKELTGLEWRFIDNKQDLLVVPSELLKQTRKLKEQPRDHIVPLSTQAKTLLSTIACLNGSGKYLFPMVRNRQKTMSREAVAKALNKTLIGTPLEGRQDAHGLRSIFRTYLSEQKIPLVVAELALSHLSTGKEKTEATYDRNEFLEERKQALQLIGNYCEQCGMKLKIDFLE